ncbi:AAA family ATPase [Pontibacillus salicampi]|uniref:Nuclease SbcCD subunit C n=1 Tax=Pontibacillus salicampi TaxID=1449801 RepID=A0ABV6LLG5_9BACI
MRAIYLSIEAFGPYNDQQKIDFTELGHESIFLITGPTGAGKTSVFDAMVYALYGRASGTDRDQDTLKSHFAKEGQMTEVQFQFSLKEQRYEVIRTPKQWKHKERGEGLTEQPPKAELYKVNHDGKELIASKIKEVNEAIEGMLHLDYEQFRKMIMIPQGEFRKLISENSKEREEILQKIFQTYVYEHMTGKLKEESKQLREQLESLSSQEEAEIDKLYWPEDQKQSISTSSKALTLLDEELQQDQQTAKDNHLKIEGKRTEWRQEQEKYYQQKQLIEQFQLLHELRNKIHTIQQQEASMKDKENKIILGDKAQMVLPYENQANRFEEERVKQEKRLKEKEDQLQQVKKTFTSMKERYQEEEARTEEREELSKWIQDQYHMLEKLRIYQSQQETAGQLEHTKQLQTGKVSDLRQKVESYKQSIQELTSATTAGQRLHKEYYQLESQITEADYVIEQTSKLIQEDKRLVEMRTTYQRVSKQYENIKERLEQGKGQLRGLEEEQKQHQAVRLAAKLGDGTACPVCGSTEHPQKAETSHEYVKDETIEAKKREVEEEEQRLQRQQEKFIEVKSEGQSQRHTVDQLMKTVLPYKEKVGIENNEQLLSFWQEQKIRIEQQQATLHKQLQKIEEDVQSLETYQNALKQSEEALEIEEGKRQRAHDQWLEVRTKLEQLSSELPEERKDANTVEAILTKEQQRYEDWMNAVEELKQQYEAKKEELNKLETEWNQQKMYVEESKGNEERANKEWKLHLENSGFTSIQDYQSAKLSDAARETLKEEVAAFRKQQQATADRLSTLEEELQDKEKPNLSEQETRLETLESHINKLAEQLQQLQWKIKEHKRIHDHLEQLIESRKEKEEKYYYIGELAQLARGDNSYKLSFERYVLSAFLDEIIVQANIRLDQMTEHRYQLERSQERAKGGAQSGLDLEVLDHYTGQKRSVKTLSGGEGFKAALSLALGMADVVQSQAGGVQLDTLFIDEGFGTLDERSLEQAISCLKDLQKGNRMLGIISHVPQLKQEIKAKLQITPTPQGSTCAFAFG